MIYMLFMLIELFSGCLFLMDGDVIILEKIIRSDQSEAQFISCVT